MIKFTINGSLQQLDIDPETPLLWVIRDHLKLTGTKYGCGKALCGACTAYLNGQPIRTCVTPIQAIDNQTITTIEGLTSDISQAVQQAWQSLNVVQCGYCQSGQIMSATALLTNNPNPDDAAIDNAMSGNICRCATYVRIRKAIKLAAQLHNNQEQPHE